MRNAIVACLLAIGCVGFARPATAQRIDESLRVNPDASIRIVSLAGTIRITGWDENRIVVAGTVPIATGRFYIGGGGSGAKLGVELTDPSRPAEAELEIHVPRQAKVWVKTESGTIIVEGLARTLDAFAVSGSILVRGAPPQTFAESMDGAIDIEGNVTWLRARTADGRISFRGAAEDVAATTVSGAIRLGGGPYERARVNTITGTITFEGAVDRAGTYSFETHSGDIDLRFIPPVHIELEVSSIAGKVTNLLTRDRPTPGRGARGQELMLLTGDGGAHVLVRTFKGEVRIKP